MGAKLKEGFRKFKENLRGNLLKNDEGLELVEIAIGFAILAALIAIVFGIVKLVKFKTEKSAEEVESGFELIGGSNTNS